VTKTILSYLSSKGWNIVAYDFPQSGTGIMLHPDRNYSEKNKGGIIPDIVAVKKKEYAFSLKIKTGFIIQTI
jgi:hypothetical protein